MISRPKRSQAGRFAQIHDPKTGPKVAFGLNALLAQQ